MATTNKNNESNQAVKVETNAFILILNEPCVESRLYNVLGINPKVWYTLKDRGIIPINGTYGEYLSKVFTHYREQQDVALAKVEANKEVASSKRNYKSSETESGLPRVVEVEKLQNIKLSRAREEQVHIQNLKERSTIIDKESLLSSFSPIISNIASILRNAASQEPKLQDTIDKCFMNLFHLGELLLQQANLDSERYVKEMLSREVDLEDAIANSGLDLK
jgi:hypothetical protein